MLPFTILIFLDELNNGQYDLLLHESIDPYKMIDLLSGTDTNNLQIDFKSRISKIGNHLCGKGAPTDEILELIESGNSPNLFPNLYKTNIPQKLLSNTRDISSSVTTRVFENLAIGSIKYKKLTGTSPVIECPSYLETFDEIQLAEKWQKFLMDYNHKNVLNCSFMTARPTMPPQEIHTILPGYFPEGEAAMALLKVNIPLIGYGRLQFISNRYNLNPDQLIKPSPFQALSAIIAAVFKNELSALETAYDFLYQQGNNLKRGFGNPLPDEFELHIFEDSFVGIKSCEQAVLALENTGFKISLKRWGITKDEEKRAQLEAKGATVFSDINKALSHIFNGFSFT